MNVALGHYRGYITIAICKGDKPNLKKDSYAQLPLEDAKKLARDLSTLIASLEASSVH